MLCFAKIFLSLQLMCGGAEKKEVVFFQHMEVLVRSGMVVESLGFIYMRCSASVEIHHGVC